MDTFDTFGNHCFHSQEHRTHGGVLSTGALPITLSGHDEVVHPGIAVARCALGKGLVLVEEGELGDLGQVAAQVLGQWPGGHLLGAEQRRLVGRLKGLAPNAGSHPASATISFAASVSSMVILRSASRCLSWLIYGVLNPYGFNPVVWASTVVCEAIYGLAGGLAKRTLSPVDRVRLKEALLLGGLGFLATFAYDVATNIAYAVAFNVPWLLALILGAPFAIVHELSNLIFFTCVAPPVAKAVAKLSPPMEGGGRWLR